MLFTALNTVQASAALPCMALNTMIYLSKKKARYAPALIFLAVFRAAFRMVWIFYFVRLSSQLLRLCAIKKRSEEHTSELQSRENLVCRLLLEKKKKNER